MTRQRKIEANRRNARKARDPRNSNSRLQSRKNARKHGLSASILADGNLQAAAQKIARAIAGDRATDDVVEQTLIVAATELDIQRICQARLAVIERAMREAERTNSATAAAFLSSPPIACETAMVEGFMRAVPALRRIERYERRAHSRRHKALTRLDALLAVAQLKEEL